MAAAYGGRQQPPTLFFLSEFKSRPRYSCFRPFLENVQKATARRGQSICPPPRLPAAYTTCPRCLNGVVLCVQRYHHPMIERVDVAIEAMRALPLRCPSRLPTPATERAQEIRVKKCSNALQRAKK